MKMHKSGLFLITEKVRYRQSVYSKNFITNHPHQHTTHYTYMTDNRTLGENASTIMQMAVKLSSTFDESFTETSSPYLYTAIRRAQPTTCCFRVSQLGTNSSGNEKRYVILLVKKILQKKKRQLKYNQRYCNSRLLDNKYYNIIQI